MDDFERFCREHPFLDLDVEVPEFVLPYMPAISRDIPGLSLREQDYISIAAMAAHEGDHDHADHFRRMAGY
jgi:hypothetical protein